MLNVTLSSKTKEDKMEKHVFIFFTTVSFYGFFNQKAEDAA